MSDAWGGASGSAATFNPLVVKQLLADLEGFVDSLEKYYDSMNVDTMQRREAHKDTRQRAYDTSNRLRALLQLPAGNSTTEKEKERLLAEAQRVLTRFSDTQRRTVDIDGEIVSQMRRSLSSGTATKSQDIVLNNQIVLKSVDINQEMLKEYNDELAKATEGMKELEEIAREMQALTNAQGTKLNQAEKQTRDADVEIIVGTEEQSQASKYKCGSRWCTLIIVLIVIGVLLVLALILGLAIGLNRKKK